MARTGRIKTDGDAHYHLMSRTNDRRFLFEKGEVKTELLDSLRRAAAFCGIRVMACTVMSNHFHVLVKVQKPDGEVGADELLRRVGMLKGEKAMRELSEHWASLSAAGLDAVLKKEQDRLRARMHDVSEFVKLFKEDFDRVYKRSRKYCGSIWSGRFASTLVDDGGNGEYLSRCMRYIAYNPVRAGLVAQARDYRWTWCENESEAAAFAGPVPGEWCLARVAQMGAVKVFGSVGFVMTAAFSLGGRFRSGVGPHPVGDIGHSTHGWRLAKAAA